MKNAPLSMYYRKYDSQEIPDLLRNTMVHNRVHKILALDDILREINPTPTCRFLTTYFPHSTAGSP